MPALTTLAIVGGGLIAGGAATSAIAGGATARAQDRAGRAQLAAAEAGVGLAREAIDRQLDERRRLEQLAAPSQAELDNIDLILRTTEEGLSQALARLDQEAKILDATDPVIQEAAGNLTNLLRGEQSKFLKPLREQRRRQKSQLEQQLAGQLGPGFRTSAAGIQALNQFDVQSDEVLTNAQFQATNQVAQILQGTAQIRRGFATDTASIFAGAVAGQRAALQGRQSIEERQLRAASIQPVDFGLPVQAQQAVIGAAEAPFVGDITRAQTVGQIGQTFGELGGFALGGALGGFRPQSFGDISGAAQGAFSTSSGGRNR